MKKEVQKHSRGLGTSTKSSPEWKRKRIGDTLRLVNGAAFKPIDWSPTGIPIVRIQNLNNPEASFNRTTRELPEKFRLRGGELLFAWSGTPGTSFGAHIWRGGEAWLNQHIFHVLFDETEWDIKFLQFAINQNLTEYVRAAHGGAGLAHITKGTFEESELLQPTLDEQRRIVAEIEKQFTRLDAGVAALKRVQANLKRYRVAVLKAACEGKLVPTEAELARRERREYEHASTRLSLTSAPQRPNRWASRSKDVIPGHAALAIGIPTTTLSEGWAWSALVEIAKMESGHTPSRNHPEWWGGDIAWVGIADAREHDGCIIHDTFQHTNYQGIENSAARLLPAGTVCISRTASVGYVVVMGREMATSQDFVNWIPTSAVTSDWLRVVFSADREALRRFGKGSVHKTIYFPEWLSMHVAVPPLAEQRRIVAEVERRLSVVEELEATVKSNLLRAKTLRQSVLQQAFIGNLLGPFHQK
jgi:type I restriction enzyme S subunit